MMGVYRTDYLMWGAKVDPTKVSKLGDDLEAEKYDEAGKRFDLVYDGMSGQYAVAGEIICKTSEHEGLAFKVIEQSDLAWRASVASAVQGVFPEAEEFSLIMFSHYH